MVTIVELSTTDRKNESRQSLLSRMHYISLCNRPACYTKMASKSLDGLGGFLPGSAAADSGSTLVELVGVSLVAVGHWAVGLLLLQELSLGHGGQLGHLVDDRSFVESLVDANGVVDDGRLDGLTLDHGLDRLVDVVVLVGVDLSTEVGLSALHVVDNLLVGVLRALLVELLLVLGEHVLLVLTQNLRGGLDDVRGFEGLGIVDGLDTVLVVVNVPLSVDGLDGLNALLGNDVLLNDLGGDL